MISGVLPSHGAGVSWTRVAIAVGEVKTEKVMSLSRLKYLAGQMGDLRDPAVRARLEQLKKSDEIHKVCSSSILNSLIAGSFI